MNEIPTSPYVLLKWVCARAISTGPDAYGPLSRTTVCVFSMKNCFSIEGSFTAQPGMTSRDGYCVRNPTNE